MLTLLSKAVFLGRPSGSMTIAVENSFDLLPGASKWAHTWATEEEPDRGGQALKPILQSAIASWRAQSFHTPEDVQYSTSDLTINPYAHRTVTLPTTTQDPPYGTKNTHAPQPWHQHNRERWGSFRLGRRKWWMPWSLVMALKPSSHPIYGNGRTLSKNPSSTSPCHARESRNTP